MKICWDNLEHIVVMPPLGNNHNLRWFYYADPDEMTGRVGSFTESEEPCKECGEYFLKKLGSKETFCSEECITANKKKSTAQKNIDKRLKENGGGWHLVGNNNNNNNNGGWNKGLKTGIPERCGSYMNYADKLSWFVAVREDPEDYRILQVKCCVCNQWFRPERKKMDRVIAYANGKIGKDTWGFYCSTECQNKCPHFGKSTATIMKNDYLNGPNAKYSEKHNIPDTVLYYDWREDLKKLQDKLGKRYEKRKLRRRIKTELEKQRMAIKRAKNKLRKDHRTPRLKRLLYLSTMRAKQKGWEHNLDFDWLIKNTPEKCPKCNITFDFDMERNMNPWAPSIDRIDSSKGYTKDNCIVVSWMYNCGKNCYDEKTLYIICKSFLNTFDHDNG